MLKLKRAAMSKARFIVLFALAATLPIITLFIVSGTQARSSTSDRQLVQSSRRHPVQDSVFYFVLPDRFANGNDVNDTDSLGGDTDKDVLRHGYNPRHKGYYHGGDIAGLRSKLNYLKGMGVTAIWMTPVFKNKPVQGDGTIAGSSSGYHGYWITDFTQIDPHLGPNEELQTLIKEAHARGMKVFFDIITNHTADVISYKEGKNTYRNKNQFPYKNVQGETFDDRNYVGMKFPKIDANVSFPYTPEFLNESDLTVKKPNWLNDPIYYHG